jgi:hypothetical protein
MLPLLIAADSAIAAAAVGTAIAVRRLNRATAKLDRARLARP